MYHVAAQTTSPVTKKCFQPLWQLKQRWKKKNALKSWLALVEVDHAPISVVVMYPFFTVPLTFSVKN